MLNSAIVLTLAGLILTIAGLLLNLRKEKGERRKAENELAKERAYKELAKDHGYVLHCLERIFPGVIYYGQIHHYIRTDVMSPELIGRINRYLGDERAMAATTIFVQRNADLQNPECCRTIADVIEAVERYRLEHPDHARQIGIPERVTTSLIQI